MMYDTAGNLVLCKCGNVASGAIMGLDSYLVWCHICSPSKPSETTMMFMPPKRDNIVNPILDDSWVIDLPHVEE